MQYKKSTFLIQTKAKAMLINTRFEYLSEKILTRIEKIISFLNITFPTRYEKYDKILSKKVVFHCPK